MEVLLQLPQNSQKRIGFFFISGPTLQELCTQIHTIDYRELCSTDSSFYHNSPIKTHHPNQMSTCFPRIHHNTHNFQGELLNYSQRLGALAATEARRMGVLVKTIFFIFKFISFVLLAYERMPVYHVNAVPAKTRSGHQIPRN